MLTPIEILAISPIVKGYIYLAGGLSIIVAVIIFCAFIQGKKMRKHFDTLRDEADKPR